MPDNGKQIVKARTESHSDVSDTAPAKAYQASLTERELCGQLMRALYAASYHSVSALIQSEGESAIWRRLTSG